MRHILITTTLAVLSGAACASLRPAIPEQASAAEVVTPELAVLEGRPDTLLLRASYADAEEGDTLQLVRASNDGEPVALVVVELKDDFLRLVRESHLGLSDDGVEKGTTYRYRVDVLGSEGELVASSDTLEVDWDEVPSRPESLVVRELSADTVEVVWSPTEPAAIFMRDVLRPESGVQRFDVERAAGGMWIVRGLATDGVYAFRVSIGREWSGGVRYGVPSEEVYVTMGESRTEGQP